MNIFGIRSPEVRLPPDSAPHGRYRAIRGRAGRRHNEAPRQASRRGSKHPGCPCSCLDRPRDYECGLTLACGLARAGVAFNLASGSPNCKRIRCSQSALNDCSAFSAASRATSPTRAALASAAATSARLSTAVPVACASPISAPTSAEHAPVLRHEAHADPDPGARGVRPYRQPSPRAAGGARPGRRNRSGRAGSCSPPRSRPERADGPRRWR